MFLPISHTEAKKPVDFIMVTAEAYVDHASFGHALVARLFESYGYSVAVMYNPKSAADYSEFGEPNIAFLVSGGAVDSMVNNYTVSKHRRKTDIYTPGGICERPDRAVTVYCQGIRRQYPDVAILIGGVEASLRRLAHYDYWSDSVMPSILESSGADLLIYGMGEKPIADIVERLKKGIPIKRMRDVRGTAYYSDYDGLSAAIKAMIEEKQFDKFAMLPGFTAVSTDKKQYAQAFKVAYINTDYVTGKMLIEKQVNGYVVVNAPQAPLTEKEMDYVYALPFERNPHPSYLANGKKVASIDEVKFSITTHRGCYGGCGFCALTFHQGRIIQTRSKQSIIDEAEKLTQMPDFKGYIHDVGGPTANFYKAACDKQKKYGVCADKECIGFQPCPNLKVSHEAYLDLLRTLRALPKVKKVFVRSGIRFDYLLMDKDRSFFKELVKFHISGQLKVAPEHIDNGVLECMNKPPFEIYEQFVKEYNQLNANAGKEQYLVPYLISSHPGCDMKAAVKLAVYLKSLGYMPEQVQDFYPTPSTRSTTMYYTGYDPMTMKPIYTAKTEEEKAMQRALLQYKLPQNRDLVIKALHSINRPDLILFLLGKNSRINGSTLRTFDGKPRQDTKFNYNAKFKQNKPKNSITKTNEDFKK
ncbi:MAG: YgiQ family radical SAM protein [Clostridia bacterium]